MDGLRDPPALRGSRGPEPALFSFAIMNFAPTTQACSRKQSGSLRQGPEAAGLCEPLLGEAPSPCLLWEMKTVYSLGLGNVAAGSLGGVPGLGDGAGVQRGHAVVGQQHVPAVFCK